MRVLVVDDDDDVRSVLSRALARDGHHVLGAEDLVSAREALSGGVDVVVLDLGLPDGSGLELCQELRASGAATPVLVLTAQTHVGRRVQALDGGADDYLAKPFAVAELRARVRALGRRAHLAPTVLWGSDDTQIDVSARRAVRRGAPVAVTAREWAIVEVLASRAGRVVPRGELLEAVWGEISDAAGSSLEVLVGRLRRKLGADVVRTLRGEGYALGGERRNARTP
jgi:two-component system OmpR family response regulator